ncbi:MAG: tetratricopeptide repeat protein [Gemmataceae bacterium]
MNDLDTNPIPAPGPGHARAVVLFVLVGLLAYFSSLHGDYVLDDFRFTKDPNIGNPFRSDMLARPVIAVSFAINYHIDGVNPRGYHATNLAAHLLAGLLVYDLVRRTLLVPRFGGRFDSTAGWIGLAAGLMWFAHPLNTQAVTYVIQRCESFMGLFLLASLWCYIRGTESPRSTWWYAAAIALCVLGAGCKEMMIVLVPLAWLYDRTFLTGSWRESLRRRWLPLALLAVPPMAGLLTLVFTGFFTDKTGTVGFGVKNFTPYTYALTQTEVILHYLKLSVRPVGLTLDYLDWKPCTSLSECWASVAAIAAIVLATAVGVIRGSAWAFPAAWFLVCLAPSSTIVPVQDAAFEHRMYLPLIGVVVLIAGGIASFRANRAIGVVAGIAVFALSLLTAARNEDYATATQFIRDNAEKRPENGRVRLNLAIQLFAQGDVAGAEEELNAAMRLPLQIPTLRQQYIKVLREAGRTANAVAEAEAALRDNPESEEIAYELGLSLLAEGRVVDALPHLERSVATEKASHFAHVHYAIALRESGQYEKAEAEYRKTRELKPDYADALIRVVRDIAADPKAKPSHVRLSLWYADAAVRMTDPPTPEMWDVLGMCQARAGRFDDAAATAKKAAEAARAKGDRYLAERLEVRAAQYRERKPNLPEQREPKP